MFCSLPSFVFESMVVVRDDPSGIQTDWCSKQADVSSERPDASCKCPQRKINMKASGPKSTAVCVWRSLQTGYLLQFIIKATEKKTLLLMRSNNTLTCSSLSWSFHWNEPATCTHEAKQRYKHAHMKLNSDTNMHTWSKTEIQTCSHEAKQRYKHVHMVI